MPYVQDIAITPTIWYLLILTGILHAIYGFVLTFTYKHGDISTLYPIVRGSGIGGAVVLSIFLLEERLTLFSGVGVSLVIGGIAILSYRRNRIATSVKGILLALTCGAFIMSYTIADKLLVADVHPIPVLAASQIISVLVFLPYVLLQKRDEMIETFKSKLKPVILISAIATSSYLIILYVMQIAPVSRIVAVREASVVFGAIAGYVILREDFSRLRLIGVISVLFGILLVKF